jgi:hypothetical protein
MLAVVIYSFCHFSFYLFLGASAYGRRSPPGALFAWRYALPPTAAPSGHLARRAMHPCRYGIGILETHNLSRDVSVVNMPKTDSFVQFKYAAKRQD